MAGQRNREINIDVSGTTASGKTWVIRYITDALARAGYAVCVTGIPEQRLTKELPREIAEDTMVTIREINLPKKLHGLGCK